MNSFYTIQARCNCGRLVNVGIDSNTPVGSVRLAAICPGCGAPGHLSSHPGFPTSFTSMPTAKPDACGGLCGDPTCTRDVEGKPNPAYETATHGCWFPCLEPHPDGGPHPLETIGRGVGPLGSGGSGDPLVFES